MGWESEDEDWRAAVGRRLQATGKIAPTRKLKGVIVLSAPESNLTREINSPGGTWKRLRNIRML
jgi:hypothetical protein